jgi:putative peptidoglycan lipid II flippase
VVLNISLNFILMQFMAHRGLALSTSITALVNYLALLYLIRKKLPRIDFQGLLPNLSKSIGICLVIYLIARGLGSILPLTSRFELILKAIIISGMSFLLFYALGMTLRLSYLREATQNIWKRLHRK